MNLPFSLERRPDEQQIGVIGAGTMGAGIAQVAAAAGHPVLLLDARPGAAADAVSRIANDLSALVGKGKIKADACAALLGRISVVDDAAQFKQAALVIEVIVEKLEVKQALLRELEAHVDPGAVIASNTSSISITALANGMRHPGRLVGMHFFNPVPIMKLVEVVSGAETSKNIADDIFELARRWGKTPVHAASTPGFIVNRIARPYYAEALALLQEQAASPEALDMLARAAGFRMGPCELMDLIGHDINYSVTVSVFEANYGDRRYVPSLVQKALVDGGRLGRKSGKGFYQGTPGRQPQAVAPSQGVAIEVRGNGPLADRLASLLDAGQGEFSRNADSDWSGMVIDGVELYVTDGRSAARLAAERGLACAAVIDVPLLAGTERALGIAYTDSVEQAKRAIIAQALAACRLPVIELRDIPGLLLARTIVMLINEGADAVWQGVCSKEGADLAMKLGTNYPAGPFEWLEALGAAYCMTVLDHLYQAYRSERYRASPLLAQLYWKERMPK
ncbi:3-hydroxyacyl-CoA dehydrogenase [Noviherbaspirillum galbum]|uniref:3-hydroxyacyl-CoA dehydrogenase n=1 Tax=Noviherbaspirillum galbum TaxID=2709383 RepID=A0A6B3SJZ2_9BURK|nr:3-hydroxyacyl-CoA dehydrogenase [Noviherbaspirillum galbum]NEX61097.1 3-hydroxyacyl-CoA dehydrogenase [Noviherbaspirillum galbum]